MAVVSKNYLLEAGVHFGHQTKRWNPKMKEYIFAARDDIYIIDLSKTVSKIEEAYQELKVLCENGGKALFVGTKKQAGEASQEEAVRSNSYFVTERWLGGTLTNFKTIRSRVNRLVEIENMEKEGKFELLPKKEVIKIKKEYDKLNKILSGIREMTRLPKAVIIVDPRKEINAIHEARKLKIPVFGIVDTNSDPDDVDFVIPANDDAVRSVKLVLGVLANAICEANGLPLIDFVGDESDGKIKLSKEEYENIQKSKYDDIEDEKKSFKKKDRKSFKKDFKKDYRKEAPKEIAKQEETKEIEESKEVFTKEVEEVKAEETTKVKKTEKPKAKKEENKKVTELPDTLAELKKLAKERGLKGYSTMKKDELKELLK